MRRNAFLITLTFVFVTTSCKRIALDNMSVKTYIKLLKSESYDFIELPPFDSKDIPELLTYIDENQIIKNYPVNPSSSFIGPDCKLGVYALWTIESIRQCSIIADQFIGRFPSGNPILMFKNSSTDIFDSELAHQTAVQTYRDWWNSNTDFGQIKNINPLGNTLYRWR